MTDGSSTPQTLVDALTRAADRATAGPPRGLTFLDRRERERFFDWASIERSARRRAGAIAATGIRPGDRVALVYPTCPEFFEAFFGTLLAGGVPVPLYPPVRLGRLEEYHRATARMIQVAGCRLVLADGRVRRILGRTVEQARPPLGCRTLDQLEPAPARGEALPTVDSAALGLVQFSSGTTVDPKPVALSHRALMAQVDALNRFWPDTGEVLHSGVSWLPLYHDMGLIGCIFTALERAADLALLGPELFVAKPALWLRAISRQRATISPAPNFAYSLCVAKIRDEELEGVDLSSWRVALNGAESVAPSVLRAFQERFARWGFRAEALTPVYGLSEASLAVTFSALDRPFTSTRFDRDTLAAEAKAVHDPEGQELVSVGRPLPGFSVEVRSQERKPLAEGSIGRVWVRGPSLMDGYLGQPKATEAALVDGWLDTGDLGFLRGGELFLTGRAKELLILRGRNYPPETVERPVDGVPGARVGCSIAVSWLPEGAEGEVLWLFVEHARDADREQVEALPEAARKAVLEKAGLAVDELFVLPPGTLPRTSSGKLRRAEALARFLAGTLEPPAKAGALHLAGALTQSSLAWAKLRLQGDG